MSDITNERLIISALLQRNTFREKVHHYIFPDYFSDAGEKAVIMNVQAFVAKYQTFPTESDLIVALKNDDSITEDITHDAVEVVKDVFDIEPSKNTEYLIDVAREFVKDKAIYNAIQKTIEIYKGECRADVGIPELLQNALSVDFEQSVGHDYLDDAEARYEYYQSPVTKIPFDIEIWNKVTGGGVEKKTLNALAAGINVGKTMSLVSLAAMYTRMGLNVFYASNEMSDMKISNRVDANNLNVPINEIKGLSREVFLGKINRLKEKGFGKLFVKDYPTGQGHAGMFMKDVRDIKNKRKVTIDVLIVDYVQICTTMTPGQRGENSYSKYKAVTEEIRAVCVLENLIGWTALQFNRGGMDNSDPGMGDVGECLSPDTIVNVHGRGAVAIRDLRVGDVINGGGKPVIVKMTHCPKVKAAYRIRTKSGREIIASGDHVFPTDRGRLSVSEMVIGEKLKTLNRDTGNSTHTTCDSWKEGLSQE